MKYELETIPVWDAFKQDSECPLCILKEKATQTYINYFIGNSVMIPEARVEVNKTGFCPEHFSDLLKKRSPHYLGLMTHTHFKEYREELEKKIKGIKANAEVVAQKKLPLKDKKLVEDCNNLVEFIQKKEKQCLVCDKIDYTMRRYTFTIIYQWKKDPEFRQAFKNSKGFCLSHLSYLTDMALEYLKGGHAGEFISELMDIQSANLKRLEDEILYFTQKFSQENDDKPWNGTKDAHYRLIQKITGKITEH